MKKFLLNSGKRRLFTAALLLGLCAALAFEALSLNALSGEIRENLLRLHIVANLIRPPTSSLKSRCATDCLRRGGFFSGTRKPRSRPSKS